MIRGVRMSEKESEASAELLLRENVRQVERRCRRRYGLGQWSKAQILEVLRELMLERIDRIARQISYLGEQAQSAAAAAECLNTVLTATARGKKRNAKRS